MPLRRTEPRRGASFRKWGEDKKPKKEQLD